MSELNETVSAYEQDITFIVGFAGSGKSTELARRYAEHKDEAVVLTPTHRAAKVLKDKGIDNVYTVYSVLKLVPTINTEFRKRGRLQKLKKVGDIDLSSIKVIFIDEFSMINTSILDTLLEVLPSTCKVYVFGDPYQLPPVMGDAVNPIDYTDDIVNLTNQYRTDAPEVVASYMKCVDYLAGTGRDLTLDPRIEQGDLSDFNKDTDRILAYTNKAVYHWNTVIGGDKFTLGQKVFVGPVEGTIAEDDIFSTRLFPDSFSKGVLRDEAELLKLYRDKLDAANKYHKDLTLYQEVGVKIGSKTYVAYYDPEYQLTVKKLKKEVESAQLELIKAKGLDSNTNITKWCRANKADPLVKARGKAWSKYLTYQEYVLNVAPTYATTVHKAQGSEFYTIYLDKVDLHSAIQDKYYAAYARLLYVALSRARERVIKITG